MSRYPEQLVRPKLSCPSLCRTSNPLESWWYRARLAIQTITDSRRSRSTSQGRAATGDSLEPAKEVEVDPGSPVLFHVEHINRWGCPDVPRGTPGPWEAGGRDPGWRGFWQS